MVKGEQMSLNESIIRIRVELQKKKLKKSGKNKFAGFEYYELSDFLPSLNELMLNEGVNDIMTIHDEAAELLLVKGDEKQSYQIPFTQFVTPTNKQGQPSMQDIQYLGALNTYYKRYLYLNAFGITDGEVIDAMEMPTYKTQSKSTDDEKQAYKKQFMAVLKSHDVSDVLDFFSFLGVDHTDEKETSNVVSKFLRGADYFENQIESYKLYKIKQRTAND